MKKLLLLFFIVFVCMLFVGCDSSEVKVESITLVDSELIYSEDFKLSDILVEVKMSDGTKSEIPLNSDMISAADLEKLSTTGKHQIKVNYLSAEQTLNINIRADETEFRVNDNYIQWKYKSESTWKNLISLNDLKGEKGSSSTVGISDDGYWVIDGIKTTFKSIPEPVVDYNVSLVLNGGVLSEGNELITLPSGSLLELPIPTKENNFFQGWYDEEGHEFTKYDVINQDLILYAKWGKAPTELETFLDSFMSDNYTITCYEYFDSSHGYYEEVSKLIKKSTVDDLVTYYYDYNIYNDNNFYFFAYDHDFAYYLWDYLDFQYDAFYESEFSSDIFNLNTKALNHSSFYFSDGKYYGYFPDEIMKDILDLDYDDENVYYSDYVVMIDLENQHLQFTIDLCISHPGYYFEYVQEIYDYYISDVGTTECEFPYWTVFDMLETSALEQREILTTEGKIAFDELFNAIKADYQKVTNISEFLDQFNKYMLDDIEFETDIRLEYLKKLERLLENESFNATDESIDEMENLYAQAVSSITEANLIRAFAYYMEYRDLISNARKTDDDKVALSEAKEEAEYRIRDLYWEVSRYVRHFNSPILYERQNYYLDLIENANTFEELEPMFKQYYDEICLMDLVFNNCFIILKEKVVGEAEDFFENLLSDLEDFEMELENVNQEYFYQFENTIMESKDLFALIGEKPLDELNEFILNAIIDYFLPLEEEAYNDTYKRVLDSEVSGVEALHQDFLNDIFDLKNYSLEELFNTDINNFNSLTNLTITMYTSFEIDELKAVRWDYIGELDYLFESLSKFATAPSLLAMESLYLEAVDELEIVAYEDLETVYFNSKAAIEEAYEEDAERIAYLEYLNEIMMMVEFIDYSMDYIHDNYDEFIVYREIYFALKEQIKTTSTVDELSALYENYLISISELSFEIYRTYFRWWKEDMLLELSYILDELVYEEGVDPTSENYLYLEALREDIVSEYYLFTLFDIYFDFQRGLKILKPEVV